MSKHAAIHADTDRFIVGIGDLRVVIKEDSGHWFAQGMEIDYVAEGTSLEDVKDRFERGLAATVHEHVKRFRTIEHLLESVPSEAWREIALGVSVKRLRYSCLQLHEVPKAIGESLPEGIMFPYSKIAYLQQQLAA